MVQGVGPRGVEVVDFELYVGPDPSRLDGGEVDAEDLRFRMSFAEVEGPDTGAGAGVCDGGGWLLCS